MKTVRLALMLLVCAALMGCPPPRVKPRPAPGPSHVPPGQIKRQTTPSGAKPVPPGQMKKAAPAPAPVVVVPIPVLPPLVVFDVEPYIFHEGFHYFLDGDVWYYSETRWGPRKKLPKSHYPKETRFKGKGKGKSRGRNK